EDQPEEEYRQQEAAQQDRAPAEQAASPEGAKTVPDAPGLTAQAIGEGRRCGGFRASLFHDGAGSTVKMRSMPAPIGGLRADSIPPPRFPAGRACGQSALRWRGLRPSRYDFAPPSTTGRQRPQNC